MVNKQPYACRIRAAEGSALRALKEKLFAHRSELMANFQQRDPNNTGAPFHLNSQNKYFCRHVYLLKAAEM